MSQEQIPAESLAEVTEIADGAAHSGGRGGQLPEEDPSETSFRECSPGTQAKRRLAGAPLYACHMGRKYDIQYLRH